MQGPPLMLIQPGGGGIVAPAMPEKELLPPSERAPLLVDSADPTPEKDSSHWSPDLARSPGPAGDRSAGSSTAMARSKGVASAAAVIVFGGGAEITFGPSAAT